LLLVGILFIAINLRPALAGVGTLIANIKEGTGLSNSLLGLLTTLPLLAFGVVSIITPLFTKRFGMGGTLLGAMVLLAVGIGIRSIDWVPALYFGTLLLGIAIAFGNVLLPSLTKRNFSKNSGLITSLYSSVHGIGSIVGSWFKRSICRERWFWMAWLSWCMGSIGTFGRCSVATVIDPT